MSLSRGLWVAQSLLMAAACSGGGGRAAPAEPVAVEIEWPDAGSLGAAGPTANGGEDADAEAAGEPLEAGGAKPDDVAP